VHPSSSAPTHRVRYPAARLDPRNQLGHTLTHSHEHTHTVHGHEHAHERPGRPVEVVYDVDPDAPTVNLRPVRTAPLRAPLRLRLAELARTVLCGEVITTLAILAALVAIWQEMDL
jgi:hypothetical protein